MHKQWRYFLLAVGFFTRIPVPALADFDAAELNRATRYFPLVGLLVGLVAAMVWWLSGLVLPPALAVLCSMATTLLLTGAFHEDGLADSADGLGGGMDKARALEIMQDSRLGSYGVVALTGILLFKFESLSALSAGLVPLALLAAHALSRLAAVYLMASASYVRAKGKSKPLATTPGRSELWLASVCGLIVWLGFAGMLSLNHSAGEALRFLLITALPVIVIWGWWQRLLLRRLQGYTGDTLGAMQQLTEVAFYLGLLAWERLA